MAWEFARDRKKRWVLIFSAWALAAGGFTCAIHWGIDSLVMPTGLMAAFGVILLIPIHKCKRCGHLSSDSKKPPLVCKKCGAAPEGPARTILEAFQGRGRLALEVPLVVMLLFIGSIRLTCVALLLVHIALRFLTPVRSRNRWMNVTAVALLVCSFAPVDVEVAGFHGPHFGDHGKGFRFVRLVKGMPMTRRCLERYGEFIAGGCVVFGNEPRWLLVWDAANGQGLSYYDSRMQAAAKAEKMERILK
jgi:ribosomal protein L37E